jgi:hypothetical protein
MSAATAPIWSATDLRHLGWPVRRHPDGAWTAMEVVSRRIVPLNAKTRAQATQEVALMLGLDAEPTQPRTDGATP